MVDYNKPTTAEDVLRRVQGQSSSSSLKRQVNANTEAITKTDTYITEFAEATIKDLEDIHNQIDGNITTYFMEGVPTLDTPPANEWVTVEEKNNHLGDLYYDKNTGYAYRFELSDGIYQWYKIQDSDVTEALAIANSAQDTADSKRRVFVEQPTTPYDVGDLWIINNTDLYRCRTSRSAGNFESVDWIKATDYSNDDYAKNVEAVLDAYKQEVTETYSTKVELETTTDTINLKVEATTTNLETLSRETNNSLLEINSRFDGYATTENLQEVTQRVEAVTTATEQNIQVIEEIKVNGVSQTITENNFTFNKDGLTLDEEGAKTKIKIDNANIVVFDKSATQEVEIFFAGFDEEKNTVEVRTQHLYVDDYLLIGKNSRIQDYVDENEEERTAVFWTGV